MEMKRIVHVLICLLMVINIAACGAHGETWQEQYDLGIRYLSEGNYEEAILAFNVAIEIDPKQAVIYVGRAQAYIGMGETEENLTTALADYEQALELDETLTDAWLGLADVYIRQGDYEKAYAVLQEARSKIGDNQLIVDKLAEMASGKYIDSDQHIRRTNSYTVDGEMDGYTVYEYDFLGRKCGWTNYDLAENDPQRVVVENTCKVDFDENSRPSRNNFYGPDGELESYDSFVYDERGLNVEQYRYEPDGELYCYFYIYYDEEGRETMYEGYHADGEMYGYWVSEYDDSGRLVKKTGYNPGGTVFDYSVVE